MAQLPQDPTPEEPEPNAAATDARVIASDQLLNGQREILIRHGSELYRLRLTRQGKLILQK